MLWNGNFNAASIVAFLKANPGIQYLLVLNEPNLVDQSNMTPQQAAQLWPQYEAIAAQTGVKIVGPAMNWGTMTNYEDPVAWLDAFYAAYQAANGNRDPQIDYIAFHWYDYGLDAQLDRLTKYDKPFWVTEFANWHSQNDGAQIDTLAKQEAQMTSMVATCESRSDVFRYAWFTGRLSPDPHYTSLLGATGQLTGTAPVAAQPRGVGLEGLPGDEPAMVIGDQDLPLLARHQPIPSMHGPALGVDPLLGAGAAEHERPGIGRVGQQIVHRRVAGLRPGDPPGPRSAGTPRQ